VARCAKAKVLFNLGREEEVDREGLKRLVKSIVRFLGPEEVLQVEAELNRSAPLSFVFVNGPVAKLLKPARILADHVEYSSMKYRTWSGAP